MMVPVGRLVVLRDAQRKEFLEAIAYLTWPVLIAPVLAPVLGALKVVPQLRASRVPPPDWTGFMLCGTVLAALVIGLELVGSAPTPWAAVVLWLLVAAAAGAATLWWFKRARHLPGSAGGGLVS